MCGGVVLCCYCCDCMPCHVAAFHYFFFVVVLFCFWFCFLCSWKLCAISCANFFFFFFFFILLHDRLKNGIHASICM